MHKSFNGVSPYAALFAFASLANALPPLGLTPVSDTATGGGLAVIDGVAYVSRANGVIPIDSEGVGSTIVPTPAASDSNLLAVTRAVPGPDGAPYIVAEYLSEPDAYGFEEYFVAWHSLASPDAPVAMQSLPSDIETRDGYTHLRGVDSDLRVLIDDGYFQLSELLLDGSSNLLELQGSQYINVFDVAPNGVAIGSAWVPNSIASAGALLYPDGRVVFTDSNLFPFGDANSVDVSPTEELNIGFWSDGYLVRYGDEPPIEIDPSFESGFGDGRVLVSESRFAVISDRSSSDPDHRAFFPGISEEGPDRSVALEDLFPALATINYDRIAGLTSQDGQVHLLLSGDAGLWLFAAPDPSLIPEPTTLGLAGLSIVAALGGHRLRR